MSGTHTSTNTSANSQAYLVPLGRPHVVSGLGGPASRPTTPGSEVLHASHAQGNPPSATGYHVPAPYHEPARFPVLAKNFDDPKNNSFICPADTTIGHVPRRLNIASSGPGNPNAVVNGAHHLPLSNAPTIPVRYVHSTHEHDALWHQLPMASTRRADTNNMSSTDHRWDSRTSTSSDKRVAVPSTPTHDHGDTDTPRKTHREHRRDGAATNHVIPGVRRPHAGHGTPRDMGGARVQSKADPGDKAHRRT